MDANDVWLFAVTGNGMVITILALVILDGTG